MWINFAPGSNEIISLLRIKLGGVVSMVEDSGLNPDDMVQITSILSSNRRSFLIKQAIPAVVAVGAGVALGVWWRRRKQRS